MSRFPLAGIRIADLTHVLAGPVCTRMLGNLGAEVVKIEPPWGRPARQAAMVEEKAEAPAYNRMPNFNEVNRAKLGVSLNLNMEEGRDLFLQLVRISDVVIENFSTRVMGNLCLNYEQLREVKPDIIMVSMPAVGSSGPWANLLSYGPGTDALSGMCDVTGYEDRGPSKPGHAYADQNCAFHVVFGILAALRYRNRTGRGQRLEVALRDPLQSVLGEFFLEYQLTGQAPKRKGNRDRSMAPHNAYPCRGEDTWVAIAVGSDEEWARLREALGNPAWSRDERFATVLGRYRHQQELDAHLSNWTREREAYEVMHLLQRNGVQAGVVLTVPQMLNDPHVQARGFIDHSQHPDAGEGLHPGVPWRLSAGSLNLGQRAPRFAEHNDYFLAELLGLDEERRRALEAQEVVTRLPVAVPENT